MMSINGASFVAYSAVTVDANAYAANYWRFKTQAGTGYNESPIEGSPLIEAILAPDAPGSMFTLDDVAYKDDNITINGNGDMVKTDAASGGFVVSDFQIPLGESGFIATQRKALPSGAERSGFTFLMIGVDVPEAYGAGGKKCLVAFYWEPDGSVWYRYKNIGSSYIKSASGVLLMNGFIRARATDSNIYLEVSNNNGTSWTQIGTTTRISTDTVPVDGILRTKTTFDAVSSMAGLFNFRLHNGS